MADRTFASLIPRVSPHVPGCPQPLMIQAIRDAAIRVCEKTLLWRYTAPVFDLLPGVHEYFYPKPPQSDAHVMFAAILNGVPLEKLTLEQAIELYPEWADLYSGEDPASIWGDTAVNVFNTDPFNNAQFNQTPAISLVSAISASGSEPRSITQLTPDRFIVLPLPDDATYSLRLFLALKPKRDAAGMDGAVLDELEESITHAALQYLLIMPNVAWSNRELAVYFGKLSLYQTTERRARANLTTARGTILARIPKIV